MTAETTRKPGRPPAVLSPTVETLAVAYTLAGLCELFDASRSVIYQAMAAGDLPRPVKLGGSKRWLGADIAAALARQSNAIGSAAASGDEVAA